MSTIYKDRFFIIKSREGSSSKTGSILISKKNIKLAVRRNYMKRVVRNFIFKNTNRKLQVHIIQFKKYEMAHIANIIMVLNDNLNKHGGRNNLHV